MASFLDLATVIGEGVDEFNASAGVIGSQLTVFVSDANVLIGATALVATTVSVVTALRQVGTWVRGPGDAAALVRHAVSRGSALYGRHAVPVRWGVVRDAITGSPLPLARISILDDRGSVIARTVADVSGVYGFRIGAQELFDRGGTGGLRAHKDGYHAVTAMHPVTAGAYVHRMDIPMTRSHPTGPDTESPAGGVRRWAATVAFWTGMVTIPLLYFANPSLPAFVVVALFGFSAIVRAVGSGRGRDRTRTL